MHKKCVPGSAALGGELESAELDSEAPGLRAPLPARVSSPLVPGQVLLRLGPVGDVGLEGKKSQVTRSQGTFCLLSWAFHSPLVV